MGKLALESLENGMPGIEPALGECCAHAASVCLEHETHTPYQTRLRVDGSRDVTYDLTWAPATDQMRRSRSDLQDATEWSASWVAALLVEDIFGYQVLQRSWKGTGFDYWIGYSDNIDPMFQNKVRLEVTGILHGSEGDISARLKDKLNRFEEHQHELPTMVVVVCKFSAPGDRGVYQISLKQNVVLGEQGYDVPSQCLSPLENLPGVVGPFILSLQPLSP